MNSYLKDFKDEIYTSIKKGIDILELLNKINDDNCVFDDIIKNYNLYNSLISLLPLLNTIIRESFNDNNKKILLEFEKIINKLKPLDNYSLLLDYKKLKESLKFIKVKLNEFETDKNFIFSNEISNHNKILDDKKKELDNINKLFDNTREKIKNILMDYEIKIDLKKNKLTELITDISIPKNIIIDKFENKIKELNDKIYILIFKISAIKDVYEKKIREIFDLIKKDNSLKYSDIIKLYDNVEKYIFFKFIEDYD